MIALKPSDGCVPTRIAHTDTFALNLHQKLQRSSDAWKLVAQKYQSSGTRKTEQQSIKQCYNVKNNITKYLASKGRWRHSFRNATCSSGGKN